METLNEVIQCGVDQGFLVPSHLVGKEVPGNIEPLAYLVPPLPQNPLKTNIDTRSGALKIRFNSESLDWHNKLVAYALSTVDNSGNHMHGLLNFVPLIMDSRDFSLHAEVHLGSLPKRATLYLPNQPWTEELLTGSCIEQALTQSIQVGSASTYTHQSWATYLQERLIFLPENSQAAITAVLNKNKLENQRGQLIH